MAHRRQIPIAGESVWVAPAEYVIAKKLVYYRDGGSDRHLRDINAMLRLSGDVIDRALLADWIGRLGLEREWGRLEPGT